MSVADWHWALAQAQMWLAEMGPMILAMLLAGLFAGFVAGMFGIGGGFVVVPALAAVLSAFSGASWGMADDHIMHVAIGTSLASIVFTSIRSVQAHAKRGAVDFAILKQWAPWVVLGVVGGVSLTGMLDGRMLTLAFAIGVFVMGVHFLFPLIGRNAPPEAQQPRLPQGFARAALGGVLGAFSSVLGIGGGTPAVLIMSVGGVPIHRAVATAAGFGALIAVPGAIGNIIVGISTPDLPPGSFGYVNLVALAAITVMSVLTAPLGVAAAHSLNAKLLKRVFGLYLLFTAGLMLQRAAPDFLPSLNIAAWAQTR